MNRHTGLFWAFAVLLFCSFAGGGDSFRNEQMKAPKVRLAYQEKWPVLKTRLNDMHIDTHAFSIFIRGFKKEKKLEVWVRSNTDASFRLFSSYDICSSSGTPGPKRREGDGQVPEGFYKLSVFNPYSNYYVSLGLSYPNQSDRILGHKNELGGAIMIHGNCVTIGCIPLTDDKIKEVYVLAAEARNAGQKDISIHLFPAVLSPSNLADLESQFAAEPALIAFWKNLKSGYDYFEQKRKLPEVKVATNGTYEFR